MKKIARVLRQNRCHQRWRALFGVGFVLLFIGIGVSGLDTIYMAITPGKNFQHVSYPIAQEKVYLREEGIDLKILVIAATPSIQGLVGC
jgi:hypothetical protein